MRAKVNTGKVNELRVRTWGGERTEAPAESDQRPASSLPENKAQQIVGSRGLSSDSGYDRVY